MRAPGFSGGYVQDPLTGYFCEHLDRPIGDLHPILWVLARLYGNYLWNPWAVRPGNFQISSRPIMKVTCPHLVEKRFTHVSASSPTWAQVAGLLGCQMEHPPMALNCGAPGTSRVPAPRFIRGVWSPSGPMGIYGPHRPRGIISTH